MPPIRVLLADDHVLIRAGVRLLLQSIEGVEVVGEASDGHEALRLIRAHQPDIVLIDIGMSGMNGLEAAARVRRDFPGVRVIILSMHTNEEYVLRALQAGVAGYIMKEAVPVELELALSTVMKGQSYLSPAVSKYVIDEYRRHPGERTSPLDQLTPRQREILQLIAEGTSTKEIAKKLHLSIKTVETHRAQLMGRLGVHEIASLVRVAVRLGLVKEE